MSKVFIKAEDYKELLKYFLKCESETDVKGAIKFYDLRNVNYYVDDMYNINIYTDDPDGSYLDVNYNYEK